MSVKKQLDGYSEYKNADGILYKGNFADGKLYGKAKVFAPNGDLIYEGEFSGEDPETAIFDVVGTFFDKGDYEACHKIISVLAECKVPKGMIVALGLMYQNGHYVEKDLEKAFSLFAEAAELGEAHGNYCLGLMYYNGEGAPRDYSKAFDYFVEAAYAGDAYAIFCLGMMYYNGDDIGQDYSKALDYFSEAADAGVADAYFMLGTMYHYGYGVPRDAARAAEAWKIGADQGCSHCQLMLRNLESATAT